MSEKHNRSIIETSEASLVVLSIALVKLRFTNLPLVALFLNELCTKSIVFVP